MNEIMQFTDLYSLAPVAIQTGAIIAVKSVGDEGSIVYVLGAGFPVRERYEDIMDVDTVLKFNTDTQTWLSNREPEIPQESPAQVPQDRRAEALEALRNITMRTGHDGS